MIESANAQLDAETCYRALTSRDARFDGRFFVGVRTTGVYCRPVCPARTPLRRNVDFYRCAAAAELAGFRPCLRCRPEASPGTPAWLGTSATVSRAMRYIDAGALDDGGVDDLADRLGIGARHLRRLFEEHLGASPLAVAQTRRVQFAKNLITETGLSMARVAMESGFSSVRRFNAAIKQVYGVSPSELRRPKSAAARTARDSRLTLRLSYRPPFERAVWSALRQIPAGATWSYRDLAGRIGNPSACRAVGSANGRNPVAIVVPCHRVIRGDGTLGGYAGGLERKKRLLAHEKAPGFLVP